jgi:hypothetical protein
MGVVLALMETTSVSWHSVGSSSAMERVPDVTDGTCIITHKLSQQVRSRVGQAARLLERWVYRNPPSLSGVAPCDDRALGGSVPSRNLLSA